MESNFELTKEGNYIPFRQAHLAPNWPKKITSAAPLPYSVSQRHEPTTSSSLNCATAKKAKEKSLIVLHC